MQTTRAPGSTGGTNSSRRRRQRLAGRLPGEVAGGVGPELLQAGDHGDLRAVVRQRRDLHAAVPADAHDPHLSSSLVRRARTPKRRRRTSTVRSRACCAASGEPEPHVVGVLVEVQLGLDAGLDEGAVEPLALHARDEPVGRAVQQQERRGAGGDVRERAGLRGEVRHRRHRAAEQLGLPRRGVHRVGGGVGREPDQVGRGVPGDDGGHVARRPGDADVALERGVVPGQAEQRGEVARRPTRPRRRSGRGRCRGRRRGRAASGRRPSRRAAGRARSASPESR